MPKLICRTSRVVAASLLLVLGACSNHDAPPGLADAEAVVFVDHEDAAEHEYASLRAGQRAIRECMEAAGFEYIELDPGKDVFLQTGWYSGSDPAKYVAEFGYGLSIPITDESMQGFADPNDEVLDALPENLQDAWIITYQGTPESPGCANAGDVIQPAGENFQERFQRTFEHELEQMQSRIFADPRVVDADAAWVTCMKEHGFDEGWRYPQDPPAEIEERAQDLYLAGLDPNTSEEFIELQSFERAVASADLQCPNNNFGGWQSFLDEIYREYETEFFAEHEAEILALADTSTPT